jgi:O-antigen ligase
VSLTIVVHVVGFLPSRTGYLVVFALLCFSLATHCTRQWLVGAAALACVLFFVSLPAVLGDDMIQRQLAPLGQKLMNPQDQRDRQISTDVRLVFWTASLKAVTERPLLGYGSGSWNREYLRVTPIDIPTHRNIRDPHQMFLLWGVEGGAVGLSLLCATLLAIYAKSKQFARHDALSLQTILIALLVAGLTTSTIYGIGMGDFFCVGIGLLLSLGAAPRDTTNGDSCETA